MTFRHIDKTWELGTLPRCFLGSKNIDKGAYEHEAVMPAVIEGNDKVGRNACVFSGTFDNETSVPLGVD